MRFLYVINRELQTRKRELAIYGLTIVLVLLVNETIQSMYGRYTGNYPAGSGYADLFGMFLMIGGLIITSISFSHDMFSKEGQHEWLMLPATRLEKFLAKGLLAAVAYPLVLMALTVVSSLVIEALLALFFKSPFVMFDPFTLQVWDGMLTYYVWQSVFLLGATFFHRNHFLKTVLAIFVLFIAMGLLAMLFARIFFPMITGLSPFSAHLSIHLPSEADASQIRSVRLFMGIGKFFYYGLLPLFCWVTAYFKVEEVQATDAI